MNSFLKYLFRDFFLVVVSFRMCLAVPKKDFRDPFFLSEKATRKGRKSSQLKRLLGVVLYDDRIGAIISSGKKQKLVFIGDKLCGCLVKNISMSEVVLKKGTTLTKLTMNE